MTGWSNGGPATLNDYATVAYDAATGAGLWTRRYDGPSHGSDVGLSVATDGARVYVTGSSEGYLTLAYEP